MDTMQVFKFEELIFIVLEHEDGVKAAFEENHGIVVFGDTLDELADKIFVEVENYFKGEFNGSIRIREFKDTIIKLPFMPRKI